MTNSVGTTLTEKGALTLDKTGSKVLDLYAKGGAMRSRSDADVLRTFVEAFDEDALLALKTLFYLRDVRGGQGERKIFRTCLKWLAENRTSIFVVNMENIAKFGRADDLFVAFDTKAENAMVKFVRNQLAEDARKPEGESISLFAKWLPSENTSSVATRKLAHRFIKAFKVTPRKYRKVLTNLRQRLNIVESKMTDGDWSEINYEQVPSKANLNYKKAFSKHDADRYKQFIEDVKAGKKTMNSSALFPYEIIRDIVNNGGADKEALDALWKSLPDYLKTNPHNGLVLPDVSGSMDQDYGTKVKAIWVSVSLAIYFAQHSTGFFRDHFLEFSSNAVLRRIVSSNIVDAWKEVSNSTTWCGSTRLQSAFDAILTAAVRENVPQEDLPVSLIIISDMEYDQACNDNESTNFEVIKAKYKAAGYEMPKLIFWNVCARNDHSPVTKDENGTALVSGCSPSIFKSIMSESWETPYELMLETLGAERYESVRL